VRKSGGAVGGVEGLPEVVEESVGGGDGVRADLDLDGVVAAGGADEFPDCPADAIATYSSESSSVASPSPSGISEKDADPSLVTLLWNERKSIRLVL
jgi:hypothetical protein